MTCPTCKTEIDTDTAPCEDGDYECPGCYYWYPVEVLE